MAGERSRADDDRAPVPIRKTEKVSELVAREILHEIARKNLPPGTMLAPEAEMLAKYQVGRVSLREALRILEIQGLIRMKAGAGGGPAVGSASSQDFARMATMYYHVAGATVGELFDARLSIETEMAAHAARMRDPEMIEELSKNLAETEELAPVDDDVAHGEVAREFHHILMRRSGNRILYLLSRSIQDIYVERVRSVQYPPDVREETHRAHSEIAAAIEAGDDVQAGALMRAHMQTFMNHSVLANIPGLLDEVIDWR